jgi:hypothetical protein
MRSIRSRKSAKICEICGKHATFETLTTNPMSEQIIGEGANIFITIVAVIIGFVAALGFVDFLKVKKEEEEQHH